MKTKTTLMALAAVLLGSALLCQQVQAIPITGSVDMSGSATLDNILLGSATKATAFTGVSVGGVPTGSYVGTAGSVVTWTPFGWNPSSTPSGSLWSFVSGGVTYSFHLATVSISGQSDSFLNLLGTGTLSISGGVYTDTDGFWSFTISNPGSTAHANFAFTFANSQTAAVPDGGLTAAFLGFAMVGVEGLRRRISK